MPVYRHTPLKSQRKISSHKHYKLWIIFLKNLFIAMHVSTAQLAAENARTLYGKLY